MHIYDNFPPRFCIPFIDNAERAGDSFCRSVINRDSNRGLYLYLDEQSKKYIYDNSIGCYTQNHDHVGNCQAKSSRT